MWQVENRTPFAADRGWVRDRNGAEVWLVAVKCTFDILADGTLQVAEEQPPVLRVPEYHGEPGQSSVKYGSDLIFTKTTTDVIVVGHAYAPEERPVRELDAGFRVGSVQKMIKVFGDRVWTSDGPSVPQPFTKIPLVYERAFGGVDRKSAHPERDWEWRNPIGTGFTVAPENLKGVALPNTEYPKELIAAWKDHPRPAGFGAVDGHWQPRVGFAGTYDDRWQKTRKPLVPDDFEDRYFQCAPIDQQSSSFLQGGEPVVLLRLTPGGDVRFALPKIVLGFETDFYDGSREIHEGGRLHTVILEPDFPRVSIVWHTALPCHFKVHKLERTVVTFKTDRDGELSPMDEPELESA